MLPPREELAAPYFVGHARKYRGSSEMSSRSALTCRREGRLASWKAGLGTCPTGSVNLRAREPEQSWSVSTTVLLKCQHHVPSSLLFSKRPLRPPSHVSTCQTRHQPSRSTFPCFFFCSEYAPDTAWKPSVKLPMVAGNIDRPVRL